MKMPGITELVLILAIALIIFGPRKLPEVGRSIGRGIREFRSATTEVKKSVSLEDDDNEEERSSKPEKEEPKAVEAGEEATVKGSAEEAEMETEQSEPVKEEQKV